MAVVDDRCVRCVGIGFVDVKRGAAEIAGRGGRRAERDRRAIAVGDCDINCEQRIDGDRHPAPVAAEASVVDVIKQEAAERLEDQRVGGPGGAALSHGDLGDRVV